MNNFEKYEKTYFMPPVVTYDWVKKTEIEKPLICFIFITQITDEKLCNNSNDRSSRQDDAALNHIIADILQKGLHITIRQNKSDIGQKVEQAQHGHVFLLTSHRFSPFFIEKDWRIVIRQPVLMAIPSDFYKFCTMKENGRQSPFTRVVISLVQNSAYPAFLIPYWHVFRTSYRNPCLCAPSAS